MFKRIVPAMLVAVLAMGLNGVVKADPVTGEALPPEGCVDCAKKGTPVKPVETNMAERILQKLNAAPTESSGAEKGLVAVGAGALTIATLALLGKADVPQGCGDCLKLLGSDKPNIVKLAMAKKRIGDMLMKEADALEKGGVNRIEATRRMDTLNRLLAKSDKDVQDVFTTMENDIPLVRANKISVAERYNTFRPYMNAFKENEVLNEADDTAAKLRQAGWKDKEIEDFFGKVANECGVPIKK